jgi:cobyrinic acid a,c-diamide synthase
VAELLDLPVVLVVEASRQAGSLAALVRGFRDHGPPRVRLAGVVLNRVGSERHRDLLAEALASLGVPLLGVLPPDPGLELPSRHLGLLPPQELHDFGERQRLWALLAENHLDLERIWPLLAPPPARPNEGDPISWALETARPAAAALELAVPSRLPASLPVAIASDAAFHFRYPEMAELLRGVGLEPLDWSPLADMPLPSDCRAVVLPGGYPELHAARLTTSTRSLTQLREATARGMPIVAECGGLLLLGNSLADPEGGIHAMAGVLPFSASRGPLSLGYRTAEVGKDGLLVRRGEHLSGHEFHRWQLSGTGCDGVTPSAPGPVAASPGLWQLEGWGVASNSEGWTAKNLHASWLHLHWAGCPAIPWRLALAAARAAPLSRTSASPSLGRTGPALRSNAGG